MVDTIQQTQEQLLQAKSQASQARETTTSGISKLKDYIKSLPNAMAQKLLRANGYSSPLQAQIQRQKVSQARNVAQGSLDKAQAQQTEIERYQQELGQFETDFDTYLHSDSGKLQYAKEANLEGNPVYGKVVKGGTTEVVGYSYETPYGAVTDYSPKMNLLNDLAKLQEINAEEFSNAAINAGYSNPSDYASSILQEQIDLGNVYQGAKEATINLPGYGPTKIPLEWKETTQDLPTFTPTPGQGIQGQVEFDNTFGQSNKFKDKLSSFADGLMLPSVSAQAVPQFSQSISPQVQAQQFVAKTFQAPQISSIPRESSFDFTRLQSFNPQINLPTAPQFPKSISPDVLLGRTNQFDVAKTFPDMRQSTAFGNIPSLGLSDIGTIIRSGGSLPDRFIFGGIPIESARLNTRTPVSLTSSLYSQVVGGYAQRGSERGLNFLGKFLPDTETSYYSIPSGTVSYEGLTPNYLEVSKIPVSFKENKEEANMIGKLAEIGTGFGLFIPEALGNVGYFTSKGIKERPEGTSPLKGALTGLGRELEGTQGKVEVLGLLTEGAFRLLPSSLLTSSGRLKANLATKQSAYERAISDLNKQRNALADIAAKRRQTELQFGNVPEVERLGIGSNLNERFLFKGNIKEAKNLGVNTLKNFVNEAELNKILSNKYADQAILTITESKVSRPTKIGTFGGSLGDLPKVINLPKLKYSPDLNQVYTALTGDISLSRQAGRLVRGKESSFQILPSGRISKRSLEVRSPILDVRKGVGESEVFLKGRGSTSYVPIEGMPPIVVKKFNRFRKGPEITFKSKVKTDVLSPKLSRVRTLSEARQVKPFGKAKGGYGYKDVLESFGRRVSTKKIAKAFEEGRGIGRTSTDALVLKGKPQADFNLGVAWNDKLAIGKARLGVSTTSKIRGVGKVSSSKPKIPNLVGKVKTPRTSLKVSDMIYDKYGLTKEVSNIAKSKQALSSLSKVSEKPVTLPTNVKFFPEQSVYYGGRYGLSDAFSGSFNKLGGSGGFKYGLIGPSLVKDIFEPSYVPKDNLSIKPFEDLTSKPQGRLELGPKVVGKEETIQIDRFTQSPKFRQFQEITPRQDFKSKQESRQLSVVRTQTKLESKMRIPRMTLAPIRPIPKKPKPSSINFKPKKRTSGRREVSSGLFLAQIRRRGKFQTVATGRDVLSLSMSGKAKALETLGVSVRVVEAKTGRAIPLPVDQFFRPSKRDPLILVQRQRGGSGRLASRGERREIVSSRRKNLFSI